MSLSHSPDPSFTSLDCVCTRLDKLGCSKASSVSLYFDCTKKVWWRGNPES